MEKLFIGTLARRSGVPIKTIRYYEERGLLPKVTRTGSGYRLYAPETVNRLEFVKKAQALGLRLKDIRQILNLADRGRCPCGHVQKMLNGYLAELRQKVRDLKLLEKRIVAAIARDCPTSFKPRGRALCPTIQGGVVESTKGGRKR